jgi:adenylate cyclase
MQVLKKKYTYSKLLFNLSQLLFAIFYWNITIRLAILLHSLGYKTDNLSDALTKGMIFMHEKVFTGSIIISAFAIISWCIRFYIYPGLLKRYKVNQVTLAIIILDIFSFLILSTLLGMARYTFDKETVMHKDIGDFLINSTMLFFFITMLIGSYVYQLLTTLFRQIGFTRLGKIMIGYYKKPREENLIFMFLDLQSSTTFAEKLGHKKYSYFIQDCFRILSNPLLMTSGRVYQFIGDEVVVTWKASKVYNYKKAIDFFFLFTQELNENKAYFEKKYGLIPIFSASYNAGRVMLAEVGEIKTEMAFHGDVLNTAARIQKQCKHYKKPVLVTENIAQKLASQQNGYQINLVDRVKLTGKTKEVDLYEVDIYQ